MKRIPFCLSSLLLFVALGALFACAQGPETAPPPPMPPDGRFFFVGGSFEAGGAIFGNAKPVTGAPFTAQATTQITQVLSDGNQINRTETAQIARDTSGRTRRDATVSLVGPWSSAGVPREVISINDPVAGMRYVLDVSDKTAVEMSRPPRPPQEAGSVPSWRTREKDAAAEAGVQRTSVSLGTQVMSGLTVEGTRTTETIPAGAIGNQNPIAVVSERWYSPQLQEVIYSKHTDPRFGTTIYQLSNISRQEPDPSLFQVPSDYTVKDRPAMHFRGRRGNPGAE